MGKNRGGQVVLDTGHHTFVLAAASPAQAEAGFIRARPHLARLPFREPGTHRNLPPPFRSFLQATRRLLRGRVRESVLLGCFCFQWRGCGPTSKFTVISMAETFLSPSKQTGTTGKTKKNMVKSREVRFPACPRGVNERTHPTRDKLIN